MQQMAETKLESLLDGFTPAEWLAALKRDREDRAAERANGSLREFVAMMWDVLHPGGDKPFRTGWVIDALCEHLEAVSRGEIRKLLINVPPGCSKSLITNVFWPAWEWGPLGRPSLQYVSFAYAQSLTKRDNVKCRDLIRSELYQRYWGGKWEFSDAENSKIKFSNTANGYKIASSVTGTATGDRGDRLINDDPNSVSEADSDAALDEALTFYAEVLPSRTNNERSAFVTIQQRTSHRDVSSLIIAELDYVHLCLPMYFEPKFRCFTPVKPRSRKAMPKRVKRIIDEGDPIPHYEPSPDGELLYERDVRTEEGELLFPALFPPERVAEMEQSLSAIDGEYAIASQLQQRPTPRGGGMFKREWFEIVDAAPAGGIDCRAWDLAGTKSKTSPWTVGARGRMVDGVVYVTDVAREREEPGAVEQLVKNVASQDGKEVRISVPQDPGQAGKHQVQAYARGLHGYTVHFSPESGDKAARATPVAAQAKAGNVKLVRGKWNAAFLAELGNFPRGAFKDQADALSRLYAYLIDPNNTPWKVRSGGLSAARYGAAPKRRR